MGDGSDAEPEIMLTLTIVVPAVPVAQPRPRATAVGRHARVYNAPGPVDAFKASVRLAASAAFNGAPLEGPLRVDAIFVFPRTKSMIWKTKPMPRVWHAKKPDRDNLDKSVLDALTGLLWRDDAQVCAGELEKWIAAGDEQPHVRIVVSELPRNP